MNYFLLSGRILLLLLFCLFAISPGSAQKINPRKKNFGEPQILKVKDSVKVLENAKVINFGKVIYRGKIDVNTTLKRVRDGKKLDHRNDGAIFFNREGKLPRHRERDYYREFVHKMKGLPFPGPQRVILGLKGEVYYTGDHYSSFTRVR